MSFMPYSITNFIKIIYCGYTVIFITCARINHAVCKLTSFESGVWWKIKVTNDVFSKFFSEKAIINNNTTKIKTHWNKRPVKYAPMSDCEQISKT